MPPIIVFIQTNRTIPTTNIQLPMSQNLQNLTICRPNTRPVPTSTTPNLHIKT